MDAPMKPLATAVAGSNKSAHRVQQAETVAARTKPDQAILTSIATHTGGL
jgi:hypothetical protein